MITYTKDRVNPCNPCLNYIVTHSLFYASTLKLLVNKRDTLFFASQNNG